MMMKMTMTGLCRLCILLMHLFGKLLVRPWPDQPDRVLRHVVGLVERDLISRSWCVRLSVRHMLVKINQTNHVVFTSW